MILDPDRLLAGPRGRRLCLEVAQGLPERADSADSADDAGRSVRRAVFSAARTLDPAGRGVLLSAGPRGHERAEPEPESTPADVAALIAERGHPAVTDRELASALEHVTSSARYWQEPDGADVLAARPEVREALRAVAQAIADADEAGWWTTGIDRDDQWLVRFDYESERVGVDVDVTLAEWHDDLVASEERFRERAVARAAAASRPAARRWRWWRRSGGRSHDPGGPEGGPWWSIPPADLWGSTRRWSARRPPPGPAVTGPVGLRLVEDSFGPDDARVTRLDVDAGARVLEIDGPESWAELCRRCPADVTDSRHHVWFSTTGRDGPWVIPDWTLVAREVDAVHLTVAGYLTTAGSAVDVGDGWASVLAGWDPDRTFWFRGAREASDEAQQWHDEAEVGWLRTDRSFGCERRA